MPSYHDLHITTARTKRTSIFDLPYMVDVLCCRTAGWQVWDRSSVHGPDGKLIASEYPGDPLDGMVLDVAGHVIVNSLGRIASDATSFPYLLIAKQHSLPYGKVVRMAQALEDCPSITVDENLELWEQEVVTAWRAERRRRLAVEQGS